MRRDHPIVASVNSKTVKDTQSLKKKGLADHHAYTVLHAQTLTNESGDVLRLVKIRNPYGSRAKREWQLEWKDQSERDKVLLKEQMGIDDDLDGIFWMRIENYCSSFYCTSVCLYEDNYQQICLSDTHGHGEHALAKLIVHEDI